MILVLSCVLNRNFLFYILKIDGVSLCLSRGWKTRRVNAHLSRSRWRRGTMAPRSPRPYCLLANGTEHFCQMWQSPWQASHASSSGKSFWQRWPVPEIVSFPYKCARIKNVYFCITLNTTSLEGFPQKMGRQKDIHWWQLRWSSAVARAGLWRLGEVHFAVAWLGTSKLN